MSQPSPNDLFDQFVDWLDEPYETYKSNEIEVLWNEFVEKYPEGMDSWEYVPGE